MTVVYDASELGTIRALLRWRGTMLPMVLGNAPIYVLMAIHIALHVLNRFFDLPILQWSQVAVVTSLLTFFIVFYGSQCYSRMQSFYESSVGLMGCAMNWVGLVRNHLPRDGNLQWNATRLMLASMHIMYYTSQTSEGGKDISATEWKSIVDRQLLSTEEIAIVQQYKGNQQFLMVVWALDEVEHGLRSAVRPTATPDAASGEVFDAFGGDRYCVGDLLSAFRDLAFTFRGHCGQINNWMNQPVPFPYFHILTVLLQVDLLLISYSCVCNEAEGASTPFTAVVYFVICLVFLGLREVAIAMSDPFGVDDTDFDLESILSRTYKNAIACLKDERRHHGTSLAASLKNPVTERSLSRSCTLFLDSTAAEGASASSFKVGARTPSPAPRRLLKAGDKSASAPSAELEGADRRSRGRGGLSGRLSVRSRPTGSRDSYPERWPASKRGTLEVGLTPPTAAKVTGVTTSEV